MRKIIGLTEAGAAKLEQHLVESGNLEAIPLAQAISNLVTVVNPQVNNRNPELACEPWYFAIGVAGTTYPKSADEHETSDYQEVCLSYNEADFQIESHEPEFVPVANGAGKVVCSCGWSSRIQDDGAMFVDSYDAMNDWRNHAHQVCRRESLTQIGKPS